MQSYNDDKAKEIKKKVIALYLPQYHQIPENDKWWGYGFTDWINVQKAKPLFNGHRQPVVPLNENYYDLADDSVLEQQSKLALDSGVDGFCYYHYWFNGKLLLEKPLERMLDNPNVEIPFMLSWANETWARTWDGQDKKVLIQQVYGGKKEWESHLQYLIKFFKDKRYIKIDGKPVLVLYTTSRIDDCENLVNYWDYRLKELGFAGIYVIETLNYIQRKPCLNNSNGVMVFEPVYSFANELKKNDIFSKARRFISSHFGIGKVRKITAKSVYQEITERKLPYSNLFPSVFVGWDNTPRKGNNGSVIVKKHSSTFRRNCCFSFIFS